MALNDSAVLTAAVGYVYIAPVGSTGPTPAELKTLDPESYTGPSGSPVWKNVGHTSRNDMPEFGFDGGDTEIKGTWQKKRLREIQTGDPVADHVKIHLQQWDEQAFSLYFGPNASSVDGVFGVSGDFTPQEYALLIVVVDGPERVGFRAAKASVVRDDAIDLPVDDFASFPIKATFLDKSGENLYEWISDDLFGSGSGEGEGEGE